MKAGDKHLLVLFTSYPIGGKLFGGLRALFGLELLPLQAQIDLKTYISS